MGAEYVGAEFVRGQVCQGLSLSGAEMSRNHCLRFVFVMHFKISCLSSLSVPIEQNKKNIST